MNLIKLKLAFDCGVTCSVVPVLLRNCSKEVVVYNICNIETG